MIYACKKLKTLALLVISYDDGTLGAFVPRPLTWRWYVEDDVTGDDTESEGDDDLLDYDTDSDDDDDEDDLGTRPATTTSWDS